jgi:hypothetical protein
MLRTTPPPEGMGVEENCFVRRIEAHQCVRFHARFATPDDAVGGDGDAVGLRL